MEGESCVQRTCIHASAKPRKRADQRCLAEAEEEAHKGGQATGGGGHSRCSSRRAICIRQCWIDFTLRYTFSHVSLHVDGIRVNKDTLSHQWQSVNEFNKSAAMHIAKHTGLIVHIVEKVHASFFDQVANTTAV